MSKTLYLECTSGISGDMFVASMLDLGADEQVLNSALSSLNVNGFNTVISRVTKSGIDACDFDVILDAEHDNHDHDMEYLYGHTHSDEHHHSHDDHHHHHHDHEHEHEHEHHHAHHHHHEHRGMKEITEIINSASITPAARNLAIKIFDIIADAESKAHNKPKDEVHFHEVGAIDSIVDVISAAVCFDNLGFDKVICSPLSEGSGTVRCQHGILPVPVPAVTNIASSHALPIKFINVNGELITPTGAAIVAAIANSFGYPEAFTIVNTGIGAGKREYNTPGIVRAMEIKTL